MSTLTTSVQYCADNHNRNQYIKLAWGGINTGKKKLKVSLHRWHDLVQRKFKAI